MIVLFVWREFPNLWFYDSQFVFAMCPSSGGMEYYRITIHTHAHTQLDCCQLIFRRWQNAKAKLIETIFDVLTRNSIEFNAKFCLYIYFD